MTRGDVLKYAIAYALMRARKIVRGLKEGLTEEERYAVADHVVRQLNERGDSWHLDDEATGREAADNVTTRLLMGHNKSPLPFANHFRPGCDR